ncbi:SpoIIE family protein phosphatase [Streptomyces sp. SCUT-3]|uniref:SpoIIE family protein phosphatase n=3 Tax=unclassified Streptomyces TaxID=2593676 RepID=UPI0015F84538|nr:SpoIIE family protein phosphatase [Streptomyces sp. SCUT-3]QMV21941.1 SpoIIE family protein phosphatase [Streptomyces sp. SCUT-3]
MTGVTEHRTPHEGPRPGRRSAGAERHAATPDPRAAPPARGHHPVPGAGGPARPAGGYGPDAGPSAAGHPAHSGPSGHDGHDGRTGHGGLAGDGCLAGDGAPARPAAGPRPGAAPQPGAAPAGAPPAFPAPSPGPTAHDGHRASAEAADQARFAQSDRLRYLDMATRRIARGLDLDETLQGLCRASVPAFADAVLCYLRDPLPVGDERTNAPVVLRLRRTDRIPEEPDTDGSRLPLLAPTADPPGATEPVRLVPDGPLASLLLCGRPVFGGDGSPDSEGLAELLGNVPAGLPGMLPPGRRVIVAPLRGRRRVVGAVLLLRRADRPPFTEDDLLVASQLATHTALGVDKAVLYGREAYIADALQRAMLPSSLPRSTGVRLASRYLPAAETARVGGDWYDAIPLPGNRVALVVGDVMGHSMTSAAIMGQLRTTVQTLAGLDLPPEEVLHHLDEQAQRLGSDHIATCVYGVYDPVSHRLVMANAGHPPPVFLHPDGRAETLRLPPGAPIGVGGVPFESVEVPAPPGATLLLYTDGLVESRTRDVWSGVERLRERLRTAAETTRPPQLEPLCDCVLDMLGPEDRDDDIALLAARFDGIPPRDVAYWFLEPQAQTPGRARRLVRRVLQRWELDSLSESTELLVSEVVTNAVRYATRPITLRLLRTEVLRCEVGDDAPTLPRMRHAAAGDEGGRGLFMVNRLARRWGATRLSTGKVVWFEQTLPAKRPDPS